jgi:hypothetical protein
VDLSTGQCRSNLVTIPNAKTRLTQVSSSASANTFLSYDALGRITSSSQNTPTSTAAVTQPTYHFTYSYDDTGGLETITYDSGRSVKSCYDLANRLSSVTGTKAGASTPYAS